MPTPAADPSGIRLGPDGGMWLAEKTVNKVARLQPPIFANSHDLNADGRSDIVWQDASGNVALWLMNGASVLAAGGFQVPGWSIVGQRDFNANGDSDLLWRDGSGDTAVYLMNGTTVASALTIGNIPPVWSVVATGNFGGVGNSGLVWRDNASNFVIWLMNSNTVTSQVFLGNIAGWSIVGTGDFNGDGFTDLLWRDSSGNFAMWFMKGTQALSAGLVGNIPAPWSVIGTGDFNGDNQADIVWSDGSGNFVGLADEQHVGDGGRRFLRARMVDRTDRRLRRRRQQRSVVARRRRRHGDLVHERNVGELGRQRRQRRGHLGRAIGQRRVMQYPPRCFSAGESCQQTSMSAELTRPRRTFARARDFFALRRRRPMRAQGTTGF